MSEQAEYSFGDIVTCPDLHPDKEFLITTSYDKETLGGFIIHDEVEMSFGQPGTINVDIVKELVGHRSYVEVVTMAAHAIGGVIERTELIELVIRQYPVAETLDL